jgi:hypothetical protein
MLKLDLSNYNNTIFLIFSKTTKKELAKSVQPFTRDGTKEIGIHLYIYYYIIIYIRQNKITNFLFFIFLKCKECLQCTLRP